MRTMSNIRCAGPQRVAEDYERAPLTLVPNSFAPLCGPAH